MPKKSALEAATIYRKMLANLHGMELLILELLCTDPNHPSVPSAAEGYKKLVDSTVEVRRKLHTAYPQLELGRGLEHPHPRLRRKK